MGGGGPPEEFAACIARQQGVAGYSVASWNALSAPAGTPAPVLEQLQGALQSALATPAVQAQFARLGVRALPGSAAQQQRLLASEVQRWGAVIRAAKIEPQ